MHTELIQSFNAITQLSEKEETIFRQLFKPEVLKKKEYFLKSGEQNKKIAFLRKGLVRYFVMKEEAEATIEFTKEFEFIAEYQSFINRSPSVQNIQAIEDCELLVLDYEGLQKIYNETPNGNLIGRKVIEHRFNTMINQLLSIYMHNPLQRYENFTKHYTDIAQRIPQYLIASYIGIKPESLCRIRNRIAKGIY